MRATESAAASAPATYKAAGVDIAAGDAAVERIRAAVASTARPEVLGTIGGFGGCFAFDPGRYRRPVLVSSTDGVGTKALVAAAAGGHGTIGLDLVAMCVDDLVCTGAEPLFLLDYVATGALDPQQMEQIVAGVADGCRQAGCALLGGEMAEHGDSMSRGHFDLAGFAVGVVEGDDMLGPARVAVGDVLVGLASPGLRCNGYSLARHVLLERAGMALDGPAWDGADHSLGEELLAPSVIYAPHVLAVLGGVAPGAVHAVAHITGGGIPGNVARILPDGADAVLRRSQWAEPRIFGEIRRLGPVAEDEMEAVFNLGLGMVMAVEATAAGDVLAVLAGTGCPASVVGEIVPGAGGAGRVQVEAP
ncbi:MAG TPA: phosphoribosylformylglycinamidine cyclo-ligase [Acidimicrobiales bacterium]|nr:phosphoribosylformylglycinamidine cyclo-ligase [Acidimicrobiales bacterium]